MAAEGEAAALEFTPTWIVAAVCSIIVLLSLVAERCLHYLGKVTLRMCTRRVRFIDMAPHSISRCLPVALISSHLIWESLSCCCRSSRRRTRSRSTRRC